MASSDTGSLTAHNDGSKQTPDAASGSRYRFRSDLEIVRPREADSNVTIIDARSGGRHVFTADEFFVCRAADGSSTLAAIRQAFNAETGRDFPLGKLFAFFRRLRGLGLLEENMADKSDLAAPVADVPAPAPAATKSMAAGQVQEPQDPVAEQVDQANELQDLENPESGGTSGSSKTGSSGTRRGVRRGLRRAARGEVGGGPGSGNRTRSRAPTGSTDPVELRLSNTAFSRGAETGAAMPEGDFEGVGISSEALQNLRARIARRDAEDAAANEPARLSFFDPNFIFSILAAVTWPLKYLVLPLLLLAVVIPWLLYDQRELLRQDIKAFDASVVSVIILGLVIANFTSRLAQGTLIRSFGSEVRAFGIALSFGVPRFFVDLGGIATLDRRGQLWAYSAPLMWRLVLFCAGTLLWFMLRESAPAPSHLALVVGQIGLFAFLLSAWPLLPSDGSRWLVTYLARPTLRADTGRVIASWVSKSEDDSATATDKRSPVAFYLSAVALVGAAAALVAQAFFDIATMGQVGLRAGLLLLAAIIALAAWAVALWNYARSREIETASPNNALASHGSWADQTDVATERQTSLGNVGKVFWAVVAAALLAVAFLPYRYEAAGTFEILPTRRTVVTVRTAAAIDQVSVHEGDWVVANQVLAKLSTKDQQREVSTASTELQHAKAQLAQFGGDKKPAGDKGAESDLERSIANAIGDEPATTTAKDDATAANYTRTQAEQAARTEVERLTRKLAYARDQLADTTVRAPTAGRVMTPNVSLLTGTYLRRGAALLTLEDTHTLQAEINLPEADVGLVKVGDNVRLRPWANEDREISGKVTSIAPAAQAKSYGTIVRVAVSIPNPDDTLRPAMTGYAKIDGEDMRVWEAFLRRFIRIVRVEFWSWIP